MANSIPVLTQRSDILNYLRCFIAIVGLAAFSACGGGDHPDVSNVSVNLRTYRFDQAIARLDTAHLTGGLTKLKREYPFFLDFYLDTLMGFGVRGNYNETNDAVRLGLKPFLAHPDIRGLMDTVAKHFPDTRETDASLKKGFQYMRHYYPAWNVPRVVYLMTGLSKWFAFTIDTSVVGVGLDMYLGERYPFYAAVQLPDYLLMKCRPEYIPVNVFQAVYRDMYPFMDQERTLLDMMIQRGKEQYFLKMILPFTEDTTRLGFTRAQLEWCEASEAMVYNFFRDKNLLYETSLSKTIRYVTEGPFAVGMPPESPGNIGSWVGLQIVEAYVKEHPGIKLHDLLKPSDAQQFLLASRYKPR